MSALAVQVARAALTVYLYFIVQLYKSCVTRISVGTKA